MLKKDKNKKKKNNLKIKEKDFDLEEYLKKFEGLQPDYNPEYIPREKKGCCIAQNFVLK